MTINLTGIPNAQVTHVTLLGTSAGGAPTDIPVDLPVLIGDTTANRAVNASDISETKSQTGTPVSNDEGMNNFRNDVNANGEINSSDIALVNLFVRRSVFSGFDESIGYIGEDTALIEDLLRRGRVVYHDGVRVFHRRRAFPGPYLSQRWRYRVKTGEMLLRGSRVNRSKVGAFLVAGTFGILLAPLVAIPYAMATLVLGARATRLPASEWWRIPLAFAAHHLTYYFGIVWGMVRAKIRR